MTHPLIEEKRNEIQRASVAFKIGTISEYQRDLILEAALTEVYKAGEDARNRKVSELYDEMPKIHVGSMLIGAGIQKGRVWIENYEGEGGDFPIEDIEQLLASYFDKNF